MLPGISITPAIIDVGINLGAFGDGHSACFPQTSPPAPPLRIGKYFARGLIGSGGRQRKRREKNQLAPHQRGLVVDEAAFKPNFLKLLDACSPAGRGPAEDTFNRAKGDRWTMCPGATRSLLDCDRRGNHASAPYLERSSARWSMPLSNGTIAPHRTRASSPQPAPNQLRRLHRNPKHIHRRHFGELAQPAR